jgi:hypothetical protein
MPQDATHEFKSGRRVLHVKKRASRATELELCSVSPQTAAASVPSNA